MDQTITFSYEELLCLQEITELVLKENDVDKALKSTLNILSDKMGLQRGIISVYHKDLNEIHHDTFGFDNPEDTIKFRPGEGITGEVIKNGRPIAIPRLDQAPVFLDKTGVRKKLDRKELAFICVPINYKGETIGAISVDRKVKENETNDLSKEVNFLSKVAELISEILNKKLMKDENASLKEMLHKSSPVGTIVGNSKPMRELAYQISLISDKPIPVLIIGETGTGKELVAREIHNLSTRKNGPFITVNCGAIPEGLIESELFGHKKGAFTGAINDRIGKFEAAHEGHSFWMKLPNYLCLFR
jgi:Nif-specific regulatory protein